MGHRRGSPLWQDAPMSVTFRVDDVARAPEPLPTRRLGDAVGEVLALGGDPELSVVDHGPTHALLGAVHLAFAGHRPLVLSPDAVWLTIAEGVAQHVRLHAEALRPRLVRHAGKKRLEVPWDGPMPEDAASWAAIVAAFRDTIAGEVGAGRARLFECDFSTTTDVERVASQVVLMDVFAPYFDYYLYCICGIPEITLLGTVEDWRRIRARIDVLAELDLGFWTRSLSPICDHFVLAASGQADIAFWRRIYKPLDAYGGEVITGWIARLYPYLSGEGRVARQNALLDLPLDEPRDVTPEGERALQLVGVRSSEVPAGPSTARVHVVDQVRGARAEVALDGGVLAVAQDAAGRLAPVCGWALRRRPPAIASVVERIREGHAFVAAPERDARAMDRLCGPADFVGLYSELEEATLFAATRPWRIRPPREHERVLFPCPYGQTKDTLRFLDLPDGTFLAAALVESRSFLVRGRIDALEPLPPPKNEDRHSPEAIQPLPRERRSRQPVAEVSIIRAPLSEILAAALAAEGAPDLPEDGRLVDVLPDHLLEPVPPPRPRKRKRS